MEPSMCIELEKSCLERFNSFSHHAVWCVGKNRPERKKKTMYRTFCKSKRTKMSVKIWEDFFLYFVVRLHFGCSTAVLCFCASKAFVHVHVFFFVNINNKSHIHARIQNGNNAGNYPAMHTHTQWTQCCFNNNHCNSSCNSLNAILCNIFFYFRRIFSRFFSMSHTFIYLFSKLFFESHGPENNCPCFSQFLPHFH